MSSIFGDRIRVSVFGQSHSDAIGAVLDGVPAGERIELPLLRRFMERRAPGRSSLSTTRKEADEFELLCGFLPDTEDGASVISCGAPIAAIIRNRDQRSKDYEELKRVPRPGHADLTAEIKYKGFQDVRGGGHFSGRLTAPLCFAGGIAKQILARRGIFVGAHLKEVAGIPDEAFPQSPTAELFETVEAKPFPVLDDRAGQRMQQAILEAREALDSVGGIVECAAVGLPAGLGDPMFNGVENRLAAAIFGIPAVKGLEFGAGFDAARLHGSENNDPFVLRDGAVAVEHNRSGGILVDTGGLLQFTAQNQNFLRCADSKVDLPVGFH